MEPYGSIFLEPQKLQLYQVVGTTNRHGFRPSSYQHSGH